MKTLRNIAAGLLFFSLVPLQASAQTSDAQTMKNVASHQVSVAKHRVHKIHHGAKKVYHKVVSTALSPVDNAVARHRADESTESH